MHMLLMLLDHVARSSSLYFVLPLTLTHTKEHYQVGLHPLTPSTEEVKQSLCLFLPVC